MSFKRILLSCEVSKDPSKSLNRSRFFVSKIYFLLNFHKNYKKIFLTIFTLQIQKNQKDQKDQQISNQSTGFLKLSSHKNS